MISTSTPAAPAKTAGNATLRSFTIKGPAGRLEALLNQGIADAPYAAVVCHPHPKGGGTLHNKVVYHAMKALNAPEFGLGWPVLRFNFRGIGISEGGHDGEAEAGDVLAAIDWIENEFNRPIVVVGFSFGAAMALLACCSTDSRKARTNLRALAALGLPTRRRRPNLQLFILIRLFPSQIVSERRPRPVRACPRFTTCGRHHGRTQKVGAPTGRRSLFCRPA